MVFGAGRSDYLSDSPETVGQRVETRLSLFTGTWFTDTSDGTPYDTQLLGERTKAIYDAMVRRRILRTPGVIQIAEYDSQINVDTRKVTIKATIDTIYGRSTIQGTI